MKASIWLVMDPLFPSARIRKVCCGERQENLQEDG